MRYVNPADAASGGIILPTDVERELADYVEQLEATTATLVAYSQRYTEVNVAYEAGYARALLEADGKSVDVRKAQATVAVIDLFTEKLELEGKLRLIRETQHNLRAEMEAVRSIGASVRASFEVGGGSGSSQQRRQ